MFSRDVLWIAIFKIIPSPDFIHSPRQWIAQEVFLWSKTSEDEKQLVTSIWYRKYGRWMENLRSSKELFKTCSAASIPIPAIVFNVWSFWTKPSHNLTKSPKFNLILHERSTITWLLVRQYSRTFIVFTESLITCQSTPLQESILLLNMKLIQALYLFPEQLRTKPEVTSSTKTTFT